MKHFDEMANGGEALPRHDAAYLAACREERAAISAECLDLHIALAAKQKGLDEAAELAQEWEEMARDDVGGLRILYADHADMLRRCIAVAKGEDA